MKQCTILLLCFLLYTGTKVLRAQAVNLAGENFLLLNGERFKNQRVSFTKAEGDWFTTANDRHGSLAFFGNWGGRQLRLDLEWDGNKEPHVITNEIRHDGKRTGEFLITMSDQNVYGDGLNAYPNDEEEVHITVSKIDNSTVSGQINGVIHQGSEKVNVSGSFNLRKSTVVKENRSGIYKNCDNVIHDKLIGAEGRSPSECEAAFDLDVRSAVHDAVQPVVQKFQNDGWEVQRQTTLEPLTLVGRGSEKDFFQTGYELQLVASPSSATYATYQKTFSELSEKIKEPSKEGYERFTAFAYEMNAATRCNISFAINTRYGGFANFRGGAKVTQLSTHIWLVQSAYVQASTGGDENAAIDASFLYIGSWKAPLIVKTDDGSEQVKVAGVFNQTAQHLHTQNIQLRIECNAKLAKKIIDSLDLKKLEALLAN